jgi:hypothetical protein
MHQILYQYSIVLAPVLVLGTMYAISKQQQEWRRSALAAVVLAGALVSCALWGFAPFSANRVFPGTVSTSGILALNKLEDRLPPNAVVAAWYPLVSHIDQRTQVYVWPTPFSASNWGLLNDTGVRLKVAGQVQYLLLPTQLSAPNDAAVFQQISGGYRLVQSGGGYGLYEKKSTP